MKNKLAINILTSVIALILGLFGGAAGLTYITMPETDSIEIGEEVYYSYNSTPDISVQQLTGEDGEISVHFLELGNKYTGDCTYIKVTTNEKTYDILIDCGSKSNSIPVVSNYLNQYVDDNTLEFVIVTHAHQDHYAGFATSEKIDSIFDLYKCDTVITFAKTNQKETSSTYKNFKREVDEEKSTGATVVTALDCWKNQNSGRREYILDEANNISLQILYQKYYEESATTENDYSVCCLLNQGEKHFLFTGDLEHEGEKSLVANNTLPHVDLYKAGHHGSKTSSHTEMLEAISPSVVCVCCCAGSPEYTKTVQNQFPTQDFIDRISVYTDKVYVTTLCVDYDKNEFTSFNGNITIISEIKLTNISVNCSNNNTKLKDSDWFKERVQKAERTCPEAWQD